ncbi:insulin-related peptide 4-like [Anticarsia gemmatalis]|uniref:insulin-related peptide 4-like n=1 Tax=Anticarsia gemmatalis TaxID=129554 RepID=UPI003F763B57
MKLSLVLALVVVASVFSEAQGSGNVYCGRRLSNILAALCYEESSNMVKRDGGWWLDAAGVRALGGARGKRGLVDECCNKPCTIDELLTYC